MLNSSVVSSVLVVMGLLLASCAPAQSVAPPSPGETSKAPPQPSAAVPAPTPKSTGQQPKYGGILNISHYGNPGTYDPVQESPTLTLSLVAPSYSGIVQHDPLEATKVIGDLAEKWDMSPDGMSYTFYFFKNVKWHDGTPFTSEDARYTLELVRKPPRGVTSPRQEFLKAIDKIEAVGQDTLKVTLAYPSASFIHNLADGRMVIVPKHVNEAKGNMKKDVVGTGPYRFKSYDQSVCWSVVKNADYFIKGVPYLDGVNWYIIPDVATRFAALRTNRVQATPFGSQGLTPSQSEIVRKEMNDKVAVDKYPSLILLALWMPHAKAPWSDIRVRRAVELTIDRAKIVKVASEGVADIGGYMSPGGIWSLPEADLMKMPGFRPSKDADIAEAKRLMAEAGHAQGIKTLTHGRNTPEYERSMVSLKEQLAQIGIDMTITLKDSANMYDVLYKRSFDTALFAATSSYDDPDQMFGQAFVSNVPRNFSEFTDEKFDKWYDEQARTLDMAKRKEIVLDMQRRMFELIPASVLFWYAYELGRWKEVQNFKAGIGIYNNLKFQNVWLTK